MKTKVISRRSLVGLLAVGSASLIAACGGAASPTAAPAKPTEAPKPAAPAATTAPAAATKPAATAAPAAATKPAAASSPAAASTSAAASSAPATAADVVEASKKESKLLVYSIMSKTNWAPVLDGFKKQYSWVDVEALDLGSYEVFERYYSEGGSSARTADIIITSAPDAWQDFIKKGDLAEYKSPEAAKLPDWAQLAPGVYAVSTDPLVFIWNKKLIQKPPKTMAELAEMATSQAAQLNGGKIVTYNAETNATGFAANWFWAKKNGDKAWPILEAIGKTKPKLESSAGNMVNSTLSGETPLGFFVSAINVFPQLPKAQDVLGWGMIGDGTPVIVRGMGITKKAQAPNSAKLLVDYILSQAGQIAFAEGGLTAYRPDVADKAKIHLSKLAAEGGGEGNLARFSFDADIADKAKTDAFRERWKKAMGR
jgi:iron(III) transport system substrate-binding protein